MGGGFRFKYRRGVVFIYEAEFSILNFIQTLHTPFLDNLLAFITRLGDRGELWTALALSLLFSKKYRRSGICMLLSLLLTAFLTSYIKSAVMRPRPFMINEFISVYIAAPKSWSFPSGHTSSSFAAAAELRLFHKGIGTWALLGASVMAFSRLYFYVHFPSDVFVGALLGTAVAFCIYSAQKKVGDSVIKSQCFSCKK